MAKAAAGTGTVRKKTVTRSGKEYTYWEARYTAGYDPGTGKQIQRSITGKTQKDVVQRLRAATAALDAGTYQAPSKMSVGEWLDIWTKEYLGGVKPRTVDSYKSIVKNHLKPAMGAVKLESLNAHTVQEFYNSLGLSPKSVKNVHGILHKALQQAVSNGYIRFNPADACILPRVVKHEIKPLDEVQIRAFLTAIQGHRFELLYTVALFTGMREGEVLGLTWDAVDLDTGKITINKQLQKVRSSGGVYQLVTTKNSKGRNITAAPFVVSALKRVKAQQGRWKLCAGECWDNPMNLVFTDELGGHLSAQTVYLHLSRLPPP
jgi:integrase